MSRGRKGILYNVPGTVAYQRAHPEVARSLEGGGPILTGTLRVLEGKERGAAMRRAALRQLAKSRQS